MRNNASIQTARARTRATRGPYWGAVHSGQTMQVEISIRYRGITEQEYFYREWYQWDKEAVSKRIKTEAN